jgi:hypothetical protein
MRWRALYYRSAQRDPALINDLEILESPPALDAIRRDSERIGFTMASEPMTGCTGRRCQPSFSSSNG